MSPQVTRGQREYAGPLGSPPEKGLVINEFLPTGALDKVET
jgi:hypothetical protein